MTKKAATKQARAEVEVYQSYWSDLWNVMANGERLLCDGTCRDALRVRRIWITERTEVLRC